MGFTLSCRHVFVKHAGQFSEGARKGMTMLAAAGRRGHDFWAPCIVGVCIGGVTAAIIENNASAQYAKDQAQRQEDDRLRQEDDRAWHDEYRQLIQQLIDKMETKVEKLETKVGKLEDKRTSMWRFSFK